MKRVAIILGMLLTGNFSGQLYGQVPAVQNQINKLMPKPVPASPNVAALGKFGDYNVSAYNGLPDISIPIFEAQSGELKVPITLKYHAGGIKRTDHASWVGAGWALQAGGQITRKVNGKPDESDFYTTTTTPLQPTITPCSDPGDVPYLRQIALGNLDTQPDIFSYSFGKKSGNFLLSSQKLQPPYLVPYEPIVVDVVNFDNFKITDEGGILYQFGTSASGVVGGVEGSYTSAGSTQTGGTTAWHLMQITSPNSDDKIVFDYQDLGTIQYTDINDIIQLSDLCSTDNSQGPCPNAQPLGSSVNVGVTTNPKGLHRITFENGMVEFILSNGYRNDEIQSKSLEKINIYNTINGVHKLIKTYKFNYSYFRNSTNTADVMLRLDNLQLKDNADAIVQQYKFTYETTYFSWTSNIRSRDFWGFYNGANNTDLIVPQQIIVQPLLNVPGSTTPTIGTANRSVAVQYLTEGVLKKIEFPTGGYSQFDYEVNKYKENNVNYTASGLRVSKITTSDGSSDPPLIKSYKYGSDELGYGTRNFNPNQFLAHSEQQIITTCCLSGGCPGSPPPGTLQYRSRSWASNSAYDIDGYSNAPVVYLTVTEYLLDQAGNTNGKTVYEYDNGVFSGTGVDLFVPFSTNYFRDSYFWKNGNLTRKTIYDKNGSKIQETLTSYGLYASQSKFVGYAANFYNTYTLNFNCGNVCDSQEVQFAYLSQSSGALRQTGTYEYTYVNGNVNQYVTKSSISLFDPTYLQVTQSTQSGVVTGENIITKFKYPFSYTFTGSETGTAKGVKMLKDKNILATPIEQYTIKQVGSTNNVIGGQVSTFKANPGNTNYVSSDVVYLLETGAVIQEDTYYASAISSSAVTMDGRYKPRLNTFQDLNGNLQQVQQTNNMYIGYQWGYNNSLPIAEVQNAQSNKHIVYSQVTGISTIAMGGPTPSVVLNKTIIVTHPGTVYLKLGVGGNPAYTTRASYSSATLGNASNITLSKNVSCGAAPIIATFTNVPAGSHTITITLTTPDSGIPSIGACGQLDFPDVAANTVGITEFFYESFEEGSATGTATPHTGKKYLLGDYTTTFVMPNARSYTVEYWYLSGTQWIYATAPYTNGMTLTLGSAIDNVRIYPTDARMKTYVYEPGLGISSVIDENGSILYYNYDTFGRLSNIKNDKGGVEKQYSYNYKN